MPDGVAMIYTHCVSDDMQRFALMKKGEQRTMTRITKILSWVLLSFMSLMLLIGYAAVADNLMVTGDINIQAKPYEGVFITDASLVSYSGASSVGYSYFNPTNFDSVVRVSSSGGSVTYKITVFNNTDIHYWYIKPDWDDAYESNSLIGVSGGVTITTKDKSGDSGATFNTDDWIPPQTTRDFYVTYNFGSAAHSAYYVATLVNFKFGVKMDSVHDEFITILNDKISDSGYNYLAEVFDEKYAEDGTTVIANVGDDKEIFDKLFGGDLTVNVDGEEKPVTVMIRRDNVDGKSTGDSYSGTANAPTGCEYTVYITVDNLDTPGAPATVYAISYTCGANGVWYQLAQLYEGTASAKDYDTGTPGVQGAFDTATWIANPNSYEVADGITYKVGQEQGDQYDKLKTLEEIMSTNDSDIFNDIDNTRIFKKVYDILVANKNSTDPAIVNLRTAFDNASPYYRNLNNGQEFKVVREYTRSEIIPYILAIQEALDYYYQVTE